MARIEYSVPDVFTQRAVLHEFNPELTEQEIEAVLLALYHFQQVYKPQRVFCD